MYTQVLLWKYFTSAEVTFWPLLHLSLSPFGRAPKWFCFQPGFQSPHPEQQQITCRISSCNWEWLEIAVLQLEEMGHTFPMFMFDLSPPFPHGQGCNFLERIVKISFPTELCQFPAVPNICATSILNLCWKYRLSVLSGDSVTLPKQLAAKEGWWLWDHMGRKHRRVSATGQPLLCLSAHYWASRPG